MSSTRSASHAGCCRSPPARSAATTSRPPPPPPLPPRLPARRPSPAAGLHPPPGCPPPPSRPPPTARRLPPWPRHPLPARRSPPKPRSPGRGPRDDHGTRPTGRNRGFGGSSECAVGLGAGVLGVWVRREACRQACMYAPAPSTLCLKQTTVSLACAGDVCDCVVYLCVQVYKALSPPASFQSGVPVTSCSSVTIVVKMSSTSTFSQLHFVRAGGPGTVGRQGEGHVIVDPHAHVP